MSNIWYQMINLACRNKFTVRNTLHKKYAQLTSLLYISSIFLKYHRIISIVFCIKFTAKLFLALWNWMWIWQFNQKLPESALKLSLEDIIDIAGNELGELLIDNSNRDIVTDLLRLLFAPKYTSNRSIKGSCGPSSIFSIKVLNFWKQSACCDFSFCAKSRERCPVGREWLEDQESM